MTPVQKLGTEYGNTLYVKREDLIPFSFGGNKARKAALFFDEIDNGDFDCVVTYGSSSSNHCRIISNMACRRGMPCLIVSPEEASIPTYNSQMMELFGAQIRTVPVQDVHDTIENTLSELREQGRKPFFIPGGGHGNTGTSAYVECYEEILDYEKENGIHFDFIFLASGTGTTQAGLICGQLLHNDEREIIGISIARKNPRGRDVVLDSVRDYISGTDIRDMVSPADIERRTVFTDEFIYGGYGSSSAADTINNVMKKYGIPLDNIYTGKAFDGMKRYLEENKIFGKKVLFIHTGGTPLFFDFLNKEGIK